MSRDFNGVQVTRDFVREVYRKAKIKKKLIKYTKIGPPRTRLDRLRCLIAARKIYTAIKSRSNLIFVDEVQFASSALATHEWSHKKSNVTIDVKKTQIPVTRLILGISEAKGVEAFHFASRPFNSENFCEFLARIKTKKGKKTYVFMDNASYHHSGLTANRMRKHNLEPIYNFAARPDLNPIEHTNGHLKHLFRKKRLQLMMKGL